MSRGSLPRHLAELAARIEDTARGYGLDFFPVVFEMLEARDVNAVAAYGGFPQRYPSWRFGMEFERLEKGRTWGLSKIYELVINNDPTIAWLVGANSLMEQKLVMAHVFGHADFFRHNMWFASTERHMQNRMADHGERIRRYMDAFGQDAVEEFLDLALGLDGLIDPYAGLRQHLRERGALGAVPTETHARESPSERARRSFERATRSPLEETGIRPAVAGRSARLEPGRSPLDVLGFLAEEAPLERWQRDILRIVREEALYFAPQRMTKVMNEGWASYWHSRILTEGVLGPTEIIDFADCHSGATAAAPGQLNPYKLGIELFRWAEERGLDIFQLRRMHNDTSFLDELVDEEYAAASEMFVMGHNARTGRTEVLERDWRKVKEQLLAQFANGGLPRIELADDDHAGRGELSLVHVHDGRDLQLSLAAKCLEGLARLWRRPVHLLTREGKDERRLVADENGVRTLEAEPRDRGASAEPPDAA